MDRPPLSTEVMVCPQRFGYRAIVFSGSVNDKTIGHLARTIWAAREEGAAGAWVGINSGGGAPGSARVLHEMVAYLPDFPVIGHAYDVFSEGAMLLAAFPHRTISPLGKIGLHQASMNVDAGPYMENRLADLLAQARGHNEAMINFISVTLSIDTAVAREWIYHGANFIGHQAKAAGLVNEVLQPFHGDTKSLISLDFQ